uniref:Mitochondrial import inner membrane translocase subunit TIM16 n=1 Tax=Ciona savignyi TaxID=51511 RepID=H2ZNV3_CIOSA
MANNLVRIIIAGAQVVGRAFTRAVRKEFAASQQAANKAGGGEQGVGSAAQSSLLGMSLDEATQILNVSDFKSKEAVDKNFEHLMKVNDKAAGGSFYLQSKVYRAKERIDAENVLLSKPKNSKNDINSSKADS